MKFDCLKSFAFVLVVYHAYSCFQPVSEKNAKVLDLIASQLAQECKSAKQVTGSFVPGKVSRVWFILDCL